MYSSSVGHCCAEKNDCDEFNDRWLEVNDPELTVDELQLALKKVLLDLEDSAAVAVRRLVLLLLRLLLQLVKIVPSVPKGARAKPRSTQQPKNCSNSAAGVTLHRSSYSLASFPDDQRSAKHRTSRTHTVHRTYAAHPPTLSAPGQ
ncbi:hypothetical protein pipiens_004479 [Culex pipiens pipiens]|uniref:Uncharacterized protein n=1 Tax=Culex pipiens pipiens TaxID=38569 RepID=A0ABD1CIG9_CULPP